MFLRKLDGNMRACTG